MPNIDKKDLKQAIQKRYTENTFQELVFEMGYSYAGIPGGVFNTKIIGFIERVEAEGKLQEPYDKVKKDRSQSFKGQIKKNHRASYKKWKKENPDLPPKSPLKLIVLAIIVCVVVVCAVIFVIIPIIDNTHQKDTCLSNDKDNSIICGNDYDSDCIFDVIRYVEKNVKINIKIKYKENGSEGEMEVFNGSIKEYRSKSKTFLYEYKNEYGEYKRTSGKRREALLNFSLGNLESIEEKFQIDKNLGINQIIIEIADNIVENLERNCLSIKAYFTEQYKAIYNNKDYIIKLDNADLKQSIEINNDEYKG